MARANATLTDDGWLVEEIRPGILGWAQGYTLALSGDSMTSQHFPDLSCTSSYAASTGVLTVTKTAHGMATGMIVDLFNRGYASLLAHQALAITRVDADTFTVQLDADIADLPNGALSGTTFARRRNAYGSNSPVTYMQMRNGWPFHLVYNGAQSGDTVANVLTRLNRHCLNYQPTIVMMQCPGINDMSASNGPRDMETIWQDLQTLFDRIINAGCVLVALTITPVASGEARGSRATMTKVAMLRQRIMAYLQGRPNAYVVDAYADVVDPTDATGYADGTTLHTTDLIHYQAPGALLVAKRIEAAIGHLLDNGFDSLPASSIDAFNRSGVSITISVASGIATVTGASHGFLAGERVLVLGSTTAGINGWRTALTVPTANTFTFSTTAADGSASGTIRASLNNNLLREPVMSTTTGGTTANGVTGTVADRYTATNGAGNTGTLTCAASVVAHPDGYGNMQRLTITAAAANDKPQVQEEFTTALAVDIIEGQTYFAEAEFRLTSDGWSNHALDDIRFQMFFTIGGVNYSIDALSAYEGLTDNAIEENVVWHVRTPRFTVPAGTVTVAYIRAWINVRATISTGNLLMDIGRCAFRLVDTEAEASW